ncbi:hypothetical protein Dimus_010406 [Dionaea muscipula]
MTKKVRNQRKLHEEYIEKQTEKEAEKAEDSGSSEKFYDVMNDERLDNEDVTVQNVVVPALADPAPQVPAPIVLLAKKRTDSGVDPSFGSLPDFVLQHLQEEMNRALKAKIGFQELYQQLKSTSPTSPQP